MNQSGVRAALIDAYIDGGFNISTAYPNREYIPSNGTEWARVSFLPAPVEVATLGSYGEDNHSGLLQIDLFFPLYKGDGDAWELADDMSEHFKAGTDFTYNSVTVSIINSSAQVGPEENGMYRLILTVSWYSRINRSV